ALKLGATDFLTKPIDPVELILRVKSALQTRFLSLAMQNQNLLLEVKVREQTAELESSRLEVVERLTFAASLRDDDTHAHTQRVGAMAATLALNLGLSQVQSELIQLAAP